VKWKKRKGKKKWREKIKDFFFHVAYLFINNINNNIINTHRNRKEKKKDEIQIIKIFF